MFRMSRCISILMAVVLAIACMGCSTQGDVIYNDTGFYFDTVVSITLYNCGSEDIIEECFRLCDRYDRIFSPTREDSELYLLNKASEETVEDPLNDSCKYLLRYEISYDLFSAVSQALEFCDLADGSYDISIRPVTELWDFRSGQANIPDREALKRATASTDHNAISFSLADGHYYINFYMNAMKLDLGSVAKGYVADRLREYLISQGVTSALIDLGGNILTVGDKQVYEVGKLISKPFKIAIESDNRIVVSVSDASVVTSAVNKRFFIQDGIRYHHILDPRTGYPAETGVDTVSVISRDSASADILSTMCFLCGYDRSVELLADREDTAVMFILSDGSIRYIGDFEAYVIDP